MRRQFGKGRLVGLAIVAALTGIVVGWMSVMAPIAGPPPPSSTSGALRHWLAAAAAGLAVTVIDAAILFLVVRRRGWLRS